MITQRLKVDGSNIVKDDGSLFIGWGHNYDNPISGSIIEDVWADKLYSPVTLTINKIEWTRDTNPVFGNVYLYTIVITTNEPIPSGAFKVGDQVTITDVDSTFDGGSAAYGISVFPSANGNTITLRRGYDVTSSSAPSASGSKTLTTTAYIGRSTIEMDFATLKRHGCKIIRVCLQLDKFMVDKTTVNQTQFNNLVNLLNLASKYDIYVILNGANTWVSANQPDWLTWSTDEERWETQANFWKEIAKQVGGHPAVAWYSLINEPVNNGNKEAEIYTASTNTIYLNNAVGFKTGFPVGGPGYAVISAFEDGKWKNEFIYYANSEYTNFEDFIMLSGVVRSFNEYGDTIDDLNAGSIYVATIQNNQIITVSGADGGTFTLSYNGQTTNPINYNASSTDVANALKALSNIGNNNVAVSGNNGGPYTVIFQGNLIGVNSPQIIANKTNLTSSNQFVSPSITIYSRKNWLNNGFLGTDRHYNPYINLSFHGRTNDEIAYDWTAQMVNAIRDNDLNTPITVGTIVIYQNPDFSSFGPSNTDLNNLLDIISPHQYLDSVDIFGNGRAPIQEYIDNIKTFANIGKPTILEEGGVPFNAPIRSYENYLLKSKRYLAGALNNYASQGWYFGTDQKLFDITKPFMEDAPSSDSSKTVIDYTTSQIANFLALKDNKPRVTGRRYLVPTIDKNPTILSVTGSNSSSQFATSVSYAVTAILSDSTETSAQPPQSGAVYFGTNVSATSTFASNSEILTLSNISGTFLAGQKITGTGLASDTYINNVTVSNGITYIGLSKKTVSGQTDVVLTAIDNAKVSWSPYKNPETISGGEDATSLPTLAGYNVYRYGNYNDVDGYWKINSSLITDTNYFDNNNALLPNQLTDANIIAFKSVELDNLDGNDTGFEIGIDKSYIIQNQLVKSGTPLPQYSSNYLNKSDLFRVETDLNSFTIASNQDVISAKNISYVNYNTKLNNKVEISTNNYPGAFPYYWNKFPAGTTENYVDIMKHSTDVYYESYPTFPSTSYGVYNSLTDNTGFGHIEWTLGNVPNSPGRTIRGAEYYIFVKTNRQPDGGTQRVKWQVRDNSSYFLIDEIEGNYRGKWFENDAASPFNGNEGMYYALNEIAFKPNTFKIASATASGTNYTYNTNGSTVTGNHNFSIGEKVSVYGATNSNFNVTNATITNVTSTSFTVVGPVADATTSTTNAFAYSSNKGAIYQSKNPVDEIGTASISALVLTDSTKNWTTDRWKGYVVIVNSLAGTSYATIKSNTATTFTINGWSGVTPSNVGPYSYLITYPNANNPSYNTNGSVVLSTDPTYPNNSSTTYNIKTTGPHKLQVGDVVTISGIYHAVTPAVLSTYYNGQFRVSAITDTSTFQVQSSKSGGGTPGRVTVYPTGSVNMPGGLNNSATTVTITPDQLFVGDTGFHFPSSGTIIIDNEQINYTGVNTTNKQFTGCTRGANGTTASSHDDGSTVQLINNDAKVTFDRGAWNKLYDTTYSGDFVWLKLDLKSEDTQYSLNGARFRISNKPLTDLLITTTAGNTTATLSSGAGLKGNTTYNITGPKLPTYCQIKTPSVMPSKGQISVTLIPVPGLSTAAQIQAGTLESCSIYAIGITNSPSVNDVANTIVTRGYGNVYFGGNEDSSGTELMQVRLVRSKDVYPLTPATISITNSSSKGWQTGGEIININEGLNPANPLIFAQQNLDNLEMHFSPNSSATFTKNDDGQNLQINSAYVEVQVKETLARKGTPINTVV